MFTCEAERIAGLWMRENGGIDRLTCGEREREREREREEEEEKRREEKKVQKEEEEEDDMTCARMGLWFVRDGHGCMGFVLPDSTRNLIKSRVLIQPSNFIQRLRSVLN
ncbi:unnamed protein product [Prunus armeniaca]|uniref:Uncharacterized protein n=1 Tax=Prunus armeniaca TaxID=36596 RepID=A0A6J5TWV0_PRUAR|nr:unnamed protein product [Prunus armeniaca]